MDTLIKILIGLAAVWLMFGGRGVLDKYQKTKPKSPPEVAATAEPEKKSAAEPEKPATAQPVRPARPILLPALDFLDKKSVKQFTLDKVRVNHYLLAKSARCAVDSLPACLQEAIREAKIDKKDYQYTYFFDRVLIEGSGTLEWGGRDYSVRYDKLREFGWTPERANVKNNYTCAGFSYAGKNALDFIEDNLSNKELFVPIEAERYPNGQAASGQPVVDWQTVSVNPADFPLSVPDAKRREVLTERYTARGDKAPALRSFIVLEFPTGEKFLTEASDTGSAVQSKTIDWRIGNTAAEIAYKQSLGPMAKATCYVFDDPAITFEMVLEQLRNNSEEKL
jgi:hypothetical protein